MDGRYFLLAHILEQRRYQTMRLLSRGGTTKDFGGLGSVATPLGVQLKPTPYIEFMADSFHLNLITLLPRVL